MNGVLWSVRVRAGEIDAGSGVIVRDAEGLTLIVEKLCASLPAERRFRAPAPSA